jgi:hypothetical protein
MVEQARFATDGGARVAAIYRYPIKGLRGQALDGCDLSVGRVLTGDRAFALAKPAYCETYGLPIGQETNEAVLGAWAPKRFFVCGVSEPQGLTYAPVGQGWQTPDGSQALEVAGPAGRFDLRLARARAGFAEAAGLEGPLTLLRNPEGLGFGDQIAPMVSLANVATARWLAERWGLDEHPVFGLHPDRFKNNIWLEGLEPFDELDWLAGRARLRIGEAELQVVHNVGRCGNINADPVTGRVEKNYLQDLAKLALERGHFDARRARPEATFGVFALVTAGGRVGLS